MEFTTDGLKAFFETKLKESDDIDPIKDKDGLLRWWEVCRTCCERMGKPYEKRTTGVTFSPMIYFENESRVELEHRNKEARIKGFNRAKKVIIDTINDLSTFGYTGIQYDYTNNKRNIIIQNNIMQSQSQSMKIDLSAYDPKVQKCINELIAELRTDKDKNKIKKLLSRLTDISVDVLVAIFLHTIGL